MKTQWTVMTVLVLTVAVLAQGLAAPAAAQSIPLELARGSTVEVSPHVGELVTDDPVEPVPHPILSDVRIRRAMAYCTDKKALVAAAYPDLTPAEQQALIMDVFIPKDHWAYTAPITTYPFNPQKGRDLLADAGWVLPSGSEYRVKDGKELVLAYYTTTMPMRVAVAPVFQAQMRACGIHLLLTHWDAYWLFGGDTGIGTRDVEVGEWTMSLRAGDPGGDTIYACDQIPLPSNGWSGGNFTGWCNSAASEAIVKASNTELPKEERKGYYATFLELFAQDAPYVILFMREGGTVDQYGWEYIDLNHQTFDQPVEVVPESEAVPSYTDFEGDRGSFTIPAGAVQEAVTLTYRPLGAPANRPTGLGMQAKAFRLRVAVGGVPEESYSFDKPLRAKIGYGAAGPFESDSLRLYYWDGEQYQDAYMSCPENDRYRAVDSVEQTFEVSVCHLSDFVLTGRKYMEFLPLIWR
jgi:hypothetical protein